MHQPTRTTMSPYLSPQWLVGGMLLIASFLLGMAKPAVVAPLLISLAIVFYLTMGWPRTPRLRTFYALLWTVPFVIWWRYETAPATTLRYMPQAMLFFMGFYTLALGTHQLLARDSGHKDYALACSIMALGLAGVGPRHTLFLPLTVLFAILLVTYLRLEQVQRHGTGRVDGKWRYAVAIVVMIGFAGLIETLMVPQVANVGVWLINRFMPSGSIRSGAGFDRSAQLGDIPKIWGTGAALEEVMLNVFADRVDPYLRGAVYNEYSIERRGLTYTAGWKVSHERKPLEPGDTQTARNIFNTRNAPPSTKVLAEIYPSPAVSDSYFLPKGVHQVGSFASKSWHELGESMRPEGRDASGGYTFYAPIVPVMDEDKPTVQDLNIPRSVDDTIRYLAGLVMPDGLDEREKIRQLETWFARNFEYTLGFTRQSHWKDPVLEFLEDQRAAHCEYFASAAVLMLRAVHIPARYVTGFVVEEPGAGNRFWVARRRHAHAWVEAYVEDAGWITVEPTPPDGRPNGSQASAAQQRSDWLAAQWERIKQLLLTGGIFNVAWEALVSLPQKLHWGVWLGFIGMGLAWMFRDKFLGWMRPVRSPRFDARVTALRHKLARAERMLHRYGVWRPRGMTVSAYIQTVHTAPALPQPVRDEAVNMLEEFAEERYRRA